MRSTTYEWGSPYEVWDIEVGVPCELWGIGVGASLSVEDQSYITLLISIPARLGMTGPRKSTLQYSL